MSSNESFPVTHNVLVRGPKRLKLVCDLEWKVKFGCFLTLEYTVLLSASLPPHVQLGQSGGVGTSLTAINE